MSVPEASVDEDHTAVLPHDDVRAARQGSGMKPEPETGCVETLPDDHLRLCIRRADTGHHLRSCQGRPLLSQGIPFVIGAPRCSGAKEPWLLRSPPTRELPRHCRIDGRLGCH